MILARVIGNVVATQKHDKFTGSKLLCVQPIDLQGGDIDDAIVAVDSVGAGPGEIVVVVIEGRSASHAMQIELAPANAAIIGIVDQIDLDERAEAKMASSPPADKNSRDAGTLKKSERGASR